MNEFISILIYLKVNKLAEVQLSKKGTVIDGKEVHFDYMRQKMMTRKDLIDLAYNNGYIRK